MVQFNLANFEELNFYERKKSDIDPEKVQIIDKAFNEELEQYTDSNS